VLPDLRKSIPFEKLPGSFCHTGKNRLYMQMSTDHWWIDMDKENPSLNTKTRLHYIFSYRAVNTHHLVTIILCRKIFAVCSAMDKL